MAQKQTSPADVIDTFDDETLRHLAADIGFAPSEVTGSMRAFLQDYVNTHKRAADAVRRFALTSSHESDATDDNQQIVGRLTAQAMLKQGKLEAFGLAQRLTKEIVSESAGSFSATMKSFSVAPVAETNARGTIVAYDFGQGVKVDTKEGVAAVKKELKAKADLYKTCGQATKKEAQAKRAQIKQNPAFAAFWQYQKLVALRSKNTVPSPVDFWRSRDAESLMLTSPPHKRLVVWSSESDRLSGDKDKLQDIAKRGRANAAAAEAIVRTVAQNMIVPKNERYAASRQAFLCQKDIPEQSYPASIKDSSDLDTFFEWCVNFATPSDAGPVPLVPEKDLRQVFPAILVGVFLEKGPDSTLYARLVRTPSEKDLRKAVSELSGISKQIRMVRLISDTEHIGDSLKDLLQEASSGVESAAVAANMEKLIRRVTPSAIREHLAALDKISSRLKAAVRLAEALPSRDIASQRALCVQLKDFGLFPRVQQEILELKIAHEELNNMKEKQIFFAAAANASALPTLDFSKGLLRGMSQAELKQFVGTTVRLMDLAAKGSGTATRGSLSLLRSHRDKLMRAEAFGIKDAAQLRAMAEANTAVIKNVALDSFQRILTKEDLALQYRTTVDVSSSLLTMATRAGAAAMRWFPTDAVLNVTNATGNAMDDILSGSLPVPRKASANVASSVPSKTDNLRRLFIEGLETDADAFGIFRRTPRNLANCHYFDVSALDVGVERFRQRSYGDSSVAAQRVQQDRTGESFRIIAIPALAKGLTESAQTLQEQLATPQNFAWTELMSYACVDVIRLSEKLYSEYLQVVEDARAEGVNANDLRNRLSEEGSDDDSDADPEGVEFDLSEDSLKVMQNFYKKLSQQSEDYMLPNPLWAAIEHASMPQYFYKNDLLYVIEWAIAYLKLETYKNLNSVTLTDDDLAQLAQLGRKMGYKESFGHSRWTLFNSIVNTKMFGSALVGLGVGVASSEAPGRRIASGVATAIAARVGAQLELFNPRPALIGAMVARVLQSLSCVRSINDIYFGKQAALAEIKKPLAWTLLTHEIYTSGLISFATSLRSLIADLGSFPENLSGGSLNPRGNAAVGAAVQALDAVFHGVDMLLEPLGLRGAPAFVFKFAFNSFRLMTPGTTERLQLKGEQNADMALQAYLASAISYISIGASAALPAMALSSVLSLGVQVSMTSMRAVQSLKDYLFDIILPASVRVLGQSVVDTLQKHKVLTAAVSTTALIALGTEVAFQMTGSGDYNWLTPAKESIGALDEKRIISGIADFQNFRGGLVSVLAAVNPFAHLFRFLTSPSVLDGALIFVLQQIDAGCASLPDRVRGAACSRAVESLSRIKTAYITFQAIASMAPQVGIFLPNLLPKHSWTDFGSELRNESCNFLTTKNFEGESKIGIFNDVENSNDRISALVAAVAPQVREKLTGLKEDMASLEDVDSTSAELWAGQSAEMLKSSRIWQALLDANPWVFRKMFPNQKNYNLFQLMILGLLVPEDTVVASNLFGAKIFSSLSRETPQGPPE